jgi:hypothetical protein
MDELCQKLNKCPCGEQNCFPLTADGGYGTQNLYSGDSARFRSRQGRHRCSDMLTVMPRECEMGNVPESAAESIVTRFLSMDTEGMLCPSHHSVSRGTPHEQLWLAWPKAGVDAVSMHSHVPSPEGTRPLEPRCISCIALKKIRSPALTVTVRAEKHGSSHPTRWVGRDKVGKTVPDRPQIGWPPKLSERCKARDTNRSALHWVVVMVSA